MKLNHKDLIEATARAIWKETQEACEPMCNKGLPCVCAMACAEAALKAVQDYMPDTLYNQLKTLKGEEHD